jgi:hypothetical protein
MIVDIDFSIYHGPRSDAFGYATGSLNVTGKPENGKWMSISDEIPIEEVPIPIRLLQVLHVRRAKVETNRNKTQEEESRLSVRFDDVVVESLEQALIVATFLESRLGLVCDHIAPGETGVE